MHAVSQADAQICHASLSCRPDSAGTGRLGSCLGWLGWRGRVEEFISSSAQNDDDTSGTVSAEPVVVTGENCPENLTRDLSAKSLSW